MQQKTPSKRRVANSSKLRKRASTARRPSASVRRGAPADRDKPSSGALAAAVAAAAAPSLHSAQRKRLRALAHHLTPIVHVGHTGVTDAVATATSQALLDHELIKVRLYEPEDKQGMALDLALRTRSALCGLLGHTVILYRPHPIHPTIALLAAPSGKRRP
jgi:RNA-binding protein